MKILKIFLCFSVLCTGYLTFASSEDDNNTYYDYDSEQNAEQYVEEGNSYPTAFYDWTAEDPQLSNSPGGGRGYGGGGWGYNPFRWSGGPRTWYNPFSWGNPPTAPVTTVVAPPSTGLDDDLDARINAANITAKKLELLLAKQRQLKALEELNQQGGGGAGGAGGSAQ